MGELIRNLGRYKNSVDIELNEYPNSKNKYIIHIQNKNFRIEMNDMDFCKFASDLLISKRKLRQYKTKVKGD